MQTSAAEEDRTPDTRREISENGNIVVEDPDEVKRSAERNKQPILTLMEEVLLLGLKDKQVQCRSIPSARLFD